MAGNATIHSHDHGHAHGANERAVAGAALLTGAFMLAELAGGLLSGSLALIADAGHMLTDFAALGLAWLGFRLARRPADWHRTYGFDRFSVLAAFVNGVTLFAIAAWIVVEAIGRLRDPVEVMGVPMLAIAILGLLVNLAAFRILHGADRHNLNIRAAALHVAGDLLGSVAAIAAAGVILASGWTPIDPILSVFVALVILRSALAVVRDSGRILLEAAPDGLDAGTIAAVIGQDIPQVAEVRHIHAWSITEDRPMVTLEATLAPGAMAEQTRQRIKAVLRDRLAIGHVTVEIRPPGIGQAGDEALTDGSKEHQTCRPET